MAVSKADSSRVYAMIEAKDGGLYRSDDAGQHWMRVSEDGRIRQRAWYFSKIYADPKAVDTVYALNTGMLRSTDGGKTFNLVPATHGDHHALWIDPTESKRLINANDGGASVSLDGGKTWSTQNNQPTAQFYHVATDMRFPYWVYGAQQDNSNLAVASFDDEGVIGPGGLLSGRRRRGGLRASGPTRRPDRLQRLRELLWTASTIATNSPRTSAPIPSTTPAIRPASWRTGSTGPRR